MRWLLGADRREKVGMKWWWWVFLIVSGCVDKRQSPTARGRKKERKPGLSKTRKALKVHNRTDNFLFYSFQQSFHPSHLHHSQYSLLSLSLPEDRFYYISFYKRLNFLEKSHSHSSSEI
jgi:hypothetical protein